MAIKIPEKAMNLLNDPAAVKVLSSVSANGVPHSVVVGSCMAPSPDMIVAGEVLMKTTSENLKKNSKIAVLVVKATESYLVVAERSGQVTEGALFDGMNQQLAKHGLKARSVWTFTPVAVYDQGASPAAGTKLA
ncbi:MAG: pyridoxamine 5'-phosphate oxidase family protein [Candidatus Methanomethylophilaceae archaeon]